MIMNKYLPFLFIKHEPLNKSIFPTALIFPIYLFLTFTGFSVIDKDISVISPIFC